MKTLKDIEKKIQQLESHGAIIGVHAENLITGKSFSHNRDITIGTASIIKLAIALTLLWKASKKEIDIKEKVVLNKENLWDWGSKGAGIISSFPDGTVVDLEFLAGVMLSVSDNAATTILLKYVPMDVVNAYLEQLEFAVTRLTFPEVSPKLLEAKDNYLGLTTPYEMYILLKGIVDNKFLPKEYSQLLLEMMNPEADYHRVHRYLPTERNYTEEKSVIFYFKAKGGSFPERNNLLCDLAYFTDNNKSEFIFSIFTHKIRKEDDPYLRCDSVDHPANIFIGEASLALYNELKK